MSNGELFPVHTVKAMAPGYFDEVEARCEAASPGPWLHETGKYSGKNWLLATIQLGNGSIDEEDHEIHITTDNVHASELYGDAKTDAEFIVHAREDVPTLLDACRSAREYIAILKARIAELELELATHPQASWNAER